MSNVTASLSALPAELRKILAALGDETGKANTEVVRRISAEVRAIDEIVGELVDLLRERISSLGRVV
jgi:hypothetical protein